MRKLARWCSTHSGAVLLQITPTTTEIGVEHPAKNHRFTCPIHGNYNKKRKLGAL